MSVIFFFFSSRRRHTRFDCDWSSDVCSSDLALRGDPAANEILGRWEKRLAEYPTKLKEHAAAVAKWEAEQGTGTHGKKAKIGRASCRERVEILVVAVSLKKKRDTIMPAGSGH